MQEILQDMLTCSDLKWYIKKKTGWMEDDFQEVNWKAHSDAFESLTLKNKMRITKYLHNWLYIGEKKQTFNASNTAKCPVCTTVDKEWRRLFQCTHETFKASRLHMYAKLCSDLMKAKTAPNLKACSCTSSKYGVETTFNTSEGAAG
eukprot:11606239-Ditylum_brightwellii.AAC.1